MSSGQRAGFTFTPPRSRVLITSGRVIGNPAICDEHYRLTVLVEDWPESLPGQFVHLGGGSATSDPVRDDAPTPSAARPESFSSSGKEAGGTTRSAVSAPLLRRAFSIAGLRRRDGSCEIDVIYRVVGAATRWMESLHPGSEVSVIGPLGNSFPVPSAKKQAWLVSGGVGLPPMLWLAEALSAVGKEVTAFCGARSARLLPLSFEGVEENRSLTAAAHHAGLKVDSRARRATRACIEFARSGAGAVISTDDGSLGFRGHIGEAMAAYRRANRVASSDVVVYTCGPEPMMRFVAAYCVEHRIECYACMERAMACGTGLCQSCVVPVHDTDAPDGWRYHLCCTDGPVFAAGAIIWDEVSALEVAHCGVRPVSQ